MENILVLVVIGKGTEIRKRVMKKGDEKKPTPMLDWTGLFMT